MGPDVQAYLDAKYKGTIPEDCEEVRKALQTSYMLIDLKSRLKSNLMV